MQLLLAFFFLAAAAAPWPQSSEASALSPPTSPAPAPAPASKPEEAEGFVRGCCARTLYPRLCRAGLAPYAASVHASHARLALASANLTLAVLGSLADRIPSGDSSGALGDCAEAVAAAADETARVADRLDGLEQAVGPEVIWRVDDAQTWLSAAMTYEDTCADGLRPGKSVPAPVRAELRRELGKGEEDNSVATMIN